MIDTVIAFITQSPYLTIGVGLIIASFILSILSGLIDIAVYIAIIGGIGLAIIGLIQVFAPNLLSLVVIYSIL
jgi:hypothetical protein